MNGARMNMTGLMLARQKAVRVAFCSSINWGKYLSKYWFLFAMLTLKMKMGMQQTRCSNVKMIKRLLISAEAFLHWSKTSRPPTQWYFLKSLPMTGFEPRTSGIGSDWSTNWATTTALLYTMVLLWNQHFCPTLCNQIYWLNFLKIKQIKHWLHGVGQLSRTYCLPLLWS